MGVLNEYAGVSEETTAMMPNALAKADETIDAANAKAAKRQKIEALKMKRDNLVKRNEYLQGQLKQFNDLTDDQIYAMARTKGIKDEDVKGLIEARNSQRAYEINKAGLEESKRARNNDEESLRLEKDAQYNEKLNALTEKLNDNVEKISKLNRKIASGSDKADAEDEKVGLMDQFKANKEAYKKLTGEEWTREPREASVVGGNDDNGVEIGRKELVSRIATAGEDFSKADEAELLSVAYDLFDKGMSEQDYKSMVSEIRNIIPSRIEKAEAKRKAEKAEQKADVTYGQSQADRAEGKRKEDVENKRISDKADEWETSFKGMDPTAINNLLSSIKKKDESVYNELKKRGY